MVDGQVNCGTAGWIFVEIDSLNHTLRQRYAGQDKDGNEKKAFEQSDILET